MKIRQQTFTLDDYLEQMKQMRKMGSFADLLGMIPGVNKKALAGASFDEKKIDRIQAIITSMTAKERVNPDIINSSRKIRIAKGSGTEVHDVNQFLKSFEQMQKLMKQFSNPKKMKRAMGGFGNFF